MNYPELAPCPFCGGPAFVDSPFPNADSPDYYVYHEDKDLVDYGCPASTFSPSTRAVRKFKTPKKAAESWNCRL